MRIPKVGPWLALQREFNRALVIVRGLGKLGFFAITVAYALVGVLPMATAVNANTRSRVRRHLLVVGERSEGCLDAAEAQVLHDQVIVDPVLRPFTADARLLHAAERRHFG